MLLLDAWLMKIHVAEVLHLVLRIRGTMLVKDY
jgi:hypothetical protein